jgi:hypothetical protein
VDGPVAPEFAQGTVIEVRSGAAANAPLVYRVYGLWTELQYVLQKSWFDRYATIRVDVLARNEELKLDSLQRSTFIYTGLPANPNAPLPPAPPVPGPPPSPDAAPSAGAWAATGYTITTQDGGQQPAFQVSGKRDRLEATGLNIRYHLTSNPVGQEDWFYAPEVALTSQPTRAVIDSVASTTSYHVEIAYRSDKNVLSLWRSLGEVITGKLVAVDTGSVAGRPSQDVIDQIDAADDAIAQFQQDVSDLIDTLGDTAAASQSATDAAAAQVAAAGAAAQAILAKSDAIQAKADALLAKGDAQKAAQDALGGKTDAISAKTDAVLAQGKAQASAAAALQSVTDAAAQVTLAAAKAGEASGSASSAVGAAQTAVAARDAAGSSATAASGSSVAASASYNAAIAAAASLLPERLNTRGDVWTTAQGGSPDNAAPLTAAQFTTDTGYGTVGLGGNVAFYQRGLIPATPGKIYEIEVEGKQVTVAAGDTPYLRIVYQLLDANFVRTNGTGSSGTAVLAAGQVATKGMRLSDVAVAAVPGGAPAITAWPAGTVWIRIGIEISRTGANSTAYARRISIKDVTALVGAERQAAAAVTSASAASASSDLAGQSASAARTDATNAHTDAGLAFTYRKDASDFASAAGTAAGSASQAQGVAVQASSDASNYATAAGGSSTTAKGYSDAAGASAIAANTSNLSATSAYNAAIQAAATLFPERIDTKGDLWTLTASGSPAAVSGLPSGYLYTDAGYGLVARSVLNNVICQRGLIRATPGSVFEITSEVKQEVVASGDTPYTRVILYPLDANFNYISGSAIALVASGVLAAGAVATLTGRVSDVAVAAAPGVTAVVAWPAAAVWIRVGAELNRSGLGATTAAQLRRLAVKDITTLRGSEVQAMAAVSSASAAASSATAAGASATAASTSKTNAGTSEGNALTYRNDASGFASSATESARLASLSEGVATQAGKDAGAAAKAAATSEKNASDYRDAAGNSAQASDTSKQAAQAAYTGAVQATAAIFPERIDAGGQLWTANATGNPVAAVPFPVANIETVAGYGLAAAITGDYMAFQRGVLPATVGATYEVGYEAEQVTLLAGQTSLSRVVFECLDANYALVGELYGKSSAAMPVGGLASGADRLTDVAKASPPYAVVAQAWPAGTKWIRPGVEVNKGAPGAKSRVRRITVRDITAQVAAESFASASATSASASSASAGKAGESAGAASQSEKNAATSQGLALTSEQNAAQSVTDSRGARSDAYDARDIAVQAKKDAKDAATASAGSAQTASGSVTDAGNYATAAQTSYVAAAAATAAVATLLPEVLDATAVFFTETPGGKPEAQAPVTPSLIIPTDVGYGYNSNPINNKLMTKGTLPGVVGRVYEVEVEVEQTVQGNSVGFQVGVWTLNTANVPTTNSPSLSPVQAATVGNGPVIAKFRYGSPLPLNGLPIANSGTMARLRFGVLANVRADGSVGSPLSRATIRRITVRDVTSVANAETQATAAASSATTAAAGSGTAGDWAQASEKSAKNASTSEGNASTYKDNAVTAYNDAVTARDASALSASNSKGSADAALLSEQHADKSAISSQTSAVVAVSVGGGASLHRDSVFQDWPAGAALPTDVTLVGAGTTVIREAAGALFGGQALRLQQTTTDTPAGVLLGSGRFPKPSDLAYVVFEWEATLNTATGAGFRGVGFEFQIGKSGGGYNYFRCNLGAQHPSTARNVTYRGRLLVPAVANGVVTGTPTTAACYVYTNAAIFGAALIKDITFQRVSVRPATPEEISANTAIPALQASVATQSTVTANLKGRMEAKYMVQANANGVVTGMYFLASTDSAGAGGNDSVVSTIVFKANVLTIEGPTAQGVQPFVYDATAGKLYLNAVYAKSANIDNLAVGTLKIANGAISQVDNANYAAKSGISKTGGLGGGSVYQLAQYTFNSTDVDGSGTTGSQLLQFYCENYARKFFSYTFYLTIDYAYTGGTFSPPAGTQASRIMTNLTLNGADVQNMYARQPINLQRLLTGLATGSHTIRVYVDVYNSEQLDPDATNSITDIQVTLTTLRK